MTSSKHLQSDINMHNQRAYIHYIYRTLIQNFIFKFVPFINYFWNFYFLWIKLPEGPTVCPIRWSVSDCIFWSKTWSNTKLLKQKAVLVLLIWSSGNRWLSHHWYWLLQSVQLLLFMFLFISIGGVSRRWQQPEMVQDYCLFYTSFASVAFLLLLL